MYNVQIKPQLARLPVALFFTPHAMKMACGAFIHKTNDIKEKREGGGFRGVEERGY